MRTRSRRGAGPPRPVTRSWAACAAPAPAAPSAPTSPTHHQPAGCGFLGWSGSVAGSAGWQGDGDYRAGTWFAVNFHAAVVPSYDLGHNCQPYSAAGDAGGPRAAEEPFRHSGEVFGEDADAGVGDCKPGLLPARLTWPGFDEHSSSGGREFQGVGEQVGGDLTHPGRIAPDLRAGEALAEGNAGAVEGVGQAVGCVLGDGGKVARDEPELEGGGFG
jgi:hypothetical protein